MGHGEAGAGAPGHGGRDVRAGRGAVGWRRLLVRGAGPARRSDGRRPAAGGAAAGGPTGGAAVQGDHAGDAGGLRPGGAAGGAVPGHPAAPPR